MRCSCNREEMAMTREPQRLWRHRRVATIGTALCLIAAGGVHAADAAAAAESWSVHGQFTSVTQHHPHLLSVHTKTRSEIDWLV